jgi:hypothetical protein
MEASGRFRVRGGPGEMAHVHLHVLSPWDRGPSYWSGSTRRTSDLLGGDRPERRPRAARDSNPLLIAKESTAALRRHGGRPRPGVPHARSPCCTGRRARLLHVQTTPTPWYKDGDGHGGRTAPKSGQTAAAFSRSTPPPARTATGVWTTAAADWWGNFQGGWGINPVHHDDSVRRRAPTRTERRRKRRRADRRAPGHAGSGGGGETAQLIPSFARLRTARARPRPLQTGAAA